MDNQSIKVLYVEDNPGDARLIQEMLKRGGYFRFELSSVDRLAEAVKRLEEEAFDVILLDLGLPDSQGLETLKRVRHKVPKLPIVVITGLADDTLGMEAVREGAQDYLIKGQFDGNLLIHSIRYSIARKEMEYKLREKLDEIERMNKLMVNRELQMEEMRKEMAKLKNRIGELEGRRTGK
jgi:DNA-binding NtrC family response regulator